jgi:thiamine biosynthesis lipoprotein
MRVSLHVASQTQIYRIMKVPKTLTALMLLALVCSGCGHLSRFSATEEHMGAPVTITAYARDAKHAGRAFEAAFDRIAELNLRLSDYDAESELRQLGRDEMVGVPQPISQALLTVLTEAERIGRETDGAFAVSAGPVILLWRLARARRQLPAEERLTLARSRTGLSNWQLDAERQRIILRERGMRFDLGGIAKGYVADEALRVLRRHGIRRALVDAGGDLAVGRRPPNQPGWRVQINGTDHLLRVSHCGVATSGDTARFLEIDGQRYSHLVDPRTGMGMTNRAFVTVVARSGALADAAASAVTVLGAERGISWADSRAVAVRYETIGENRKVWLSDNWPREWPAEGAAP